VDATYAFVGGLDLQIGLSGDFDRWDSPSQRYVELSFRQRRTTCAATKRVSLLWVISFLPYLTARERDNTA
jgi:hypothetical protein